MKGLLLSKEVFIKGFLPSKGNLPAKVAFHSHSFSRAGLEIKTFQGEVGWVGFGVGKNLATMLFNCNFKYLLELSLTIIHTLGPC